MLFGKVLCFIPGYCWEISENLTFSHQPTEFAEDIPKISGFRVWEIPMAVTEQNFYSSKLSLWYSSNPTAGTTKPPQIPRHAVKISLDILELLRDGGARRISQEDAQFVPPGMGIPVTCDPCPNRLGRSQNAKLQVEALFPGGTWSLNTPRWPQKPPGHPLPAASWGKITQSHLSWAEITNSTFLGLKSIPP